MSTECATKPLTFSEFSKSNGMRCIDAFHPIGDWSPTDWATALAGEVGEACNLIKKCRRGDIPQEEYHNYLQAVGDELADVVTYADLLAQKLGIDLGKAVARKFNEVSDRVGSDIKL